MAEGERIYVRNAAGGLEPLVEKRFDTEDELQKLLADYPELLDGEQMRPSNPLRWILITREQPISDTVDGAGRWSLDHMIIDQEARPTLVEVKRGNNSEVRRTVVGQMLDYAAHASFLKADDLRRTFEKSVENPDAVLSDLLDDEELDAEKFWEDVATNLTAKRLRLLFVADAIPDELAAVVKFLNEQMPTIEVLAVEIKQFKNKASQTQTLVPRIIGRLDAHPERSASSNWHPLYHEFWTDFLDVLRMKYKDWEVHKTTKGQKNLTNSYLQLDAEGKAHDEMHYSFDYARREGDLTQANFWIEPSSWGEPSKIEEAERIVRELDAQKGEIERRFSEKRFGEPLTWDPVEGRAKWGIHIRHLDKSLTIRDREPWPKVRDWGIERLGALRDAIQPHLDSLK